MDGTVDLGRMMYDRSHRDYGITYFPVTPSVSPDLELAAR